MGEIKYKVYKGSDNGKVYYRVFPGTNVPTGMTEASYTEAEAWLKQNKGDPKYSSLVEEYEAMRGKVDKTAVISEYTHPLTGEKLTNVQPDQIKAIEKEVAQVKSGEMVNIAPSGQTPLYVPKGSPGALLVQNPTEYKRINESPEAQAKAADNSAGGKKYVKVKVGNGYAYFEDTGSGYTAVMDSGVIASLSSGKMASNEVQGSQISNYKPSTDGGTGAGGSTPPPTGSGSGGDAGATPEWLLNDPDFKNLPQDMKDYLVQYYNILSINDKEQQQKLKDALDEATAQADPYWAEVMRIAKTELSRSLGENQDDFDAQESSLLESIQNINSDLSTRKGDISIDEQAELARRKRAYEQDLETLRENAAQTGLTFSSKRNMAEERLATENQDLVESTKTKYMREVRDLETAASRGVDSAKEKLAEYERVLGREQTTLIRNAEAKLGTENLPDTSSYSEGKPIGGVSGSIQEDKIKDIYTRAEALSELGNPFIK